MVLLVSQQVLIYGIYSNTVHFVFLYIYDKSRCQLIVITWFQCVKKLLWVPMHRALDEGQFRNFFLQCYTFFVIGINNWHKLACVYEQF